MSEDYQHLAFFKSHMWKRSYLRIQLLRKQNYHFGGSFVMIWCQGLKPFKANGMVASIIAKMENYNAPFLLHVQAIKNHTWKPF